MSVLHNTLPAIDATSLPREAKCNVIDNSDTTYTTIKLCTEQKLSKCNRKYGVHFENI